MHRRRLLTLAAAAALPAALLPAGAGADHSDYSIRVVNSGLGGDPGFFYVGGPMNVTLRDAQERDQRFELCMTPAPIDRPACRGTRAGRTITGLAPSEAGRTKLRVELEGGPVLVRHVRVRRASGGHEDKRPTGRLRVCAEDLELFRRPARTYIGALQEGESMRVRRFSPSGTYAYGFAYGDANKLGWVRASGLCGRQETRDG